MSRVARLGAFIVLTLAVLASGVFIIGSREYLFRATYQLKAQFDNVAGLAQGADVQVGGVHSGTVTRILLPTRPGDKVLVIMELDKSTRAIIKKDSVASIQTEGLLGNQYLAVSFGSIGQASVQDGETLQSEPPLQMADLLKKTNSILDGSQQAIQNAALATAHLNSVSAKIDAGQGTVGALVNDKQLYSNLEETTNTLHTTVLEAQTGVTDFRENMEALKHNFLVSGYFRKRGYEDSADLSANQIGELPKGEPLKTFTYRAKELFKGHDSAQLKNHKSLNVGGEFLAQSQFGFAVIVVSTGMEGDAQKDLLLTEARAVVIREYLVENFGFDDRQVKTLGMGKQSGTGPEADWGSIQILIFSVGTAIPGPKPEPAVGTSDPERNPPILVTARPSQQP